MNLIPMPRSMQPLNGSFVIQHNTAIVLDEALTDNDFETALLLQREIKRFIAMALQIKKMAHGSKYFDKNYIYLQYSDSVTTPESYRMTVRPESITISACDNRGILYGAATLIQLCRLGRAVIDCVDIFDEPSFADRGYLLDVNRGRVPKLESMKKQVDKLALYKINQLQLNMESCFQFEGLEEIWSQTDPLTPEDILELDRYCFIRGVELVPCIATFGHLYDLLRSESFQKYCELDHGAGEPFTWYHRMRYHIINVLDPDSFSLITGLLEQYIPLFRSNKINICCDETFDLGKGKSATAAEKMSYGELYLSHVNMLVEWLEAKGKDVMIWADIILNHAEYLDKLKTQVTCLNWYYYYNAKEEKVKIVADNGLKQYVCPSVSGFSRLVNYYDMSFTNIREMAKLGEQYHSTGFLNTDWGDSGHINMPALAIPCMIYGAAQGWNAGDDRDFDLIDNAISLVEYGDIDHNLVGLLRELSRQDVIIFNDIVFFRDYKVYNLCYDTPEGSLYENAKDRIMQATEEQLTTAVTRCAEIIDSLKSNIVSTHTSRHNEMEEFFLSAFGVSLMQELSLVIKKHEYGQNVALIRPPNLLAGKLEYWLSDYCKAWRAVSREGELYRIKEFIKQICLILRKYHAE